MPNSQLHTAISQPRYYRYFSACGTKQKALRLYRANINLSQELYGIIGVFEVVLRNSIDRYMISQKGNFWLEEAVSDGGYLDVNPGCLDMFHAAQEAIQKLGTEYTHDRLIAKLAFGFWTYQFASKEFAAAGSRLLNIFPKRPFGTNQKTVFKSLNKINDLRNRIAHYEPICFDGTKICIARTKRRYDLILELLAWLGGDSSRLLYGIDGVDKALTSITNIAASHL
jgi:hypothetical protein